MNSLRAARALAILSLLGLLCAGCGRQKAADDPKTAPVPPTLQVAPITRSTLERTLPVTGTLNALRAQEATLTPPVAGVLDQLPIHYGQTVQKGQIIAHLATRQFLGQIQQAQAIIGQNEVLVQQAQVNADQQRAQTRAAVDQALAALAAAKAALKREQATQTGNAAALQNAQQNKTREETLFKDGLVAQKDVQAANLAVNTAQAQLDAQRQTVEAQRQTVAGQQQAVHAARAAGMQDVVKQKDVQVAQRQVQNARGALATVRAQLSLATIRAPLSGQVTAVGATVGETVDTTTKLATIADLGTLQLQMDVPSVEAHQVHPGQAVQFSVDSLPGRIFHTTISNVATQVDPTSGAVPVLARVPNPGGRLKDNTTVKAHIAVERRAQVLTVPRSALLTDPNTGKTSVVIVGSDNVAHIRPVTVGITTDTQAEITQGVAASEQVAVSGQYGLPDGTKVNVQRQ